MASRFVGWYRKNKYPWESYDEARSRYELLYGPDKKPSKAPPKNKKLEVKFKSVLAPVMNFFTFFYLTGFIIAAFIL